jgi:maltose-binding protein MalE
MCSPESYAALTINSEFVTTALFTLEDVSALIDTSIAEHCELIQEKGAMMDKCCVDGYSWSGELLKINGNYIKLKDNLGTILPQLYETNDKGQYVRKSFNANGLSGR